MTAHKARERERRDRGVVIGFFPSTSSHVPQINTTTIGTGTHGWVIPGTVTSTYGRLISGSVIYSEGGGTVVLPNAVTISGTSPIPEQTYDEELAEQILRLAKEPPVAEFESTEELMDWLDDIDK